MEKVIASRGMDATRSHESANFDSETSALRTRTGDRVATTETPGERADR